MSLKSIINNQFESKPNSFYSFRDNHSLIKRLALSRKLNAHNGCVNTITWGDSNPNIILSGSDDQKLSITDAFSGLKKVTLPTAHRSNIFSAKFLSKSNDEKIVSCAAGGDIFLTDLHAELSQNQQNKFMCHGEKSVYELRCCQDPFTFLSCGQDGTCKFYDIRESTRCDKPFCTDHTLIKLSCGISSMAINPLFGYHLACAGLDGVVRFYDIRCLSVGSSNNENFDLNLSSTTNERNPAFDALFACFGLTSNDNSTTVDQKPNMFNNSLSNSSKRITSIQYDHYGNEVLVSYQPNLIYLLDWRNLSMENHKEFTSGHKENLSEENSSNDDYSEQGNETVEKKFRIQTDWSDTGPNSLPFNEMNNNETNRLAKRLNEWFMTMYTSRSSSGSSQSTTSTPAERSNLNSTNESAATTSNTINASTSSGTVSSSNENNNSELNLKKDEATNSNEDEESDSSEDEEETPNKKSQLNSDSNSRRTPMNFRQTNLFSITSSIIGSRIRTKQQMRLEGSIVKNKPSPKIKKTFVGHRNSRTMIKECNFWGNDYIISGSDCGHIFFWNKRNGNIVNVLEADKHVVNCIQENVNFPVLASSGIDYDVKIWQPTLEEPPEDLNSKIEMIIQKNKLMLDDTRNTILIPVQFMVPALRLFGADFGARNRINNNNNNNSNNTSQ